MPLSWNEIKTRAIAFTKEWENETSEDAEAKSFWDGFFNVFGISRRRVASFEKPVKKLDSSQGFIDLLWKGHILVEHKSRGKDLDKAFQQAKDYFPGLKEHELPKYILVSDFERFRLYDLDKEETVEFLLRDFVQHVHLFGFIAGYEKRTYKDEDPVNVEAAEKMGKLHDRLEEVGYRGHELEVYLVRLLFCLFADDTGIFEKGIFQEYIDLHTKPDGSDLAMHLASIFQVLNTPREKRFKNLDEALVQFPHVNGKLFEENLPMAAFDSQMREMLLEACGLNWSKISPAIFGSMFQAVMNPKERRNLGAHYTSEKNILKLIKPLFLDELQAEFDKIKGNKKKLNEFHHKLASLRFLDPACGCGNFLIITYRELRLLEIQVLRELNKTGQGFLNVADIIQVDVDQFYGIEIDEFAVRIAEVAMWLIDHQMNMLVSDTFGQYFVRLPLEKSATIVHGNALRLDWGSFLNKERTVNVYAKEANVVLPKAEEPDLHYGKVNVIAEHVNLVNQVPAEAVEDVNYDYILGNPPFVGKSLQDVEQRKDLEQVLNHIEGNGLLDYVAAWYIKTAKFIQETSIKAAFVSTNSIVQGEQVGILWNPLFNKFNIKIHFAHQTFRWNNESRGVAAVHCVIIGFANFDIPEKRLFSYENILGEPLEKRVRNINSYLVEGKDLFLIARRKPICDVAPIINGSKPVDGGYLILNKEERDDLLTRKPDAAKYVKVFAGADDFINGKTRWCLWLKDAQPDELRRFPEILKRIESVKIFRLKSPKEYTRKAALTPTLFEQIRQPLSDYILIPRHSSENRKYLPTGFLKKEVIVADSATFIPNASLYLFGILSSTIHMTWIKYVCGRIKSDFRYSNKIVYNNFPFPPNGNEAQKKRVEEAAQAVLDVRASFPNSSLADLYDPLTMPPALVKAHQALDKAVDLCYRPQPFVNELSRIEFLFNLYEQYTQPLLAATLQKKKAK